MENTIYFYSTTDEYGFMSNFARYPIVLKGKRWPTSEHYFQAQKFAGTDRENLIRKAGNAAQAARLGRDRTIKIRHDWEKIKKQVMLDAVRAKFTQHGDLRELLIATGNAKLVEHTANDSYWGDGGDGSGKNMLGIILMRVRDELRSKAD